MLNYYRIETVLFFNRFFYHGAQLTIDGKKFTKADLKRMCSVLGSTTHLPQQMYLLFIFAGFGGQVNFASIERLFKISGVRDLLPKTSLRDILMRVIKTENDLTKDDIRDVLKRGENDDGFKKVVAALFR